MVPLELFLIGFLGGMGYFFLLLQSILKLIKQQKILNGLLVLGVKGLPFVFLASVFHKNSSLIDVLSLTFGITLSLMLFLGIKLRGV